MISTTSVAFNNFSHKDTLKIEITKQAVVEQTAIVPNFVITSFDVGWQASFVDINYTTFKPASIVSVFEPTIIVVPKNNTRQFYTTIYKLKPKTPYKFNTFMCVSL